MAATRYRARDLLMVPNLLSGARVPLALAFALSAHHGYLELAILGAAGLTDVLDGWAARRLHQATPLGALVDGVADKVFAATVVVTLLVSGTLSPVFAILLATRELLELPLALRVLSKRRPRLAEIDRRANWLGKGATVLEFATVFAVLAGLPHTNVLLDATAVCGAAAATAYWRRELGADSARRPRAARGPSASTGERAWPSTLSPR